ncbi:MAG: HisA/HisF-related TIM barrel protein [Promethearchaeota archaeon]
MKRFKIIPVIDILNSKAVHAKKGERSDYHPLKSHLFNSSNPVEIIKILKNNYHFDLFYIADLDSIIKKTPNFQILEQILEISGIKVILDPGIVEHKNIYQFQKLEIEKLILGLETIKNFKEVFKCLQILNQNEIIISFDMYKGKILSNAKDIKNQNPIKLTKKFYSLGVRNIILLDLYRVGQKLGGIPPLYLKLLHNFNGNVFVGGGIKNLKNILEIRKHNFAGVLLATALYDGTIDIEKLRTFDLFKEFNQ